MKITKETLKQLVVEELEATLSEQAERPRGGAGRPAAMRAAQKVERQLAIAEQHLKHARKNLNVAIQSGEQLEDLHGVKATDQLRRAIKELEKAASIIEQRAGREFSDIGNIAADKLATGLGVIDPASRGGEARDVEVNPRPIRTVRGGTPRK